MTRLATMMRSISVTKHVAAPPTAVWEVLADFPNIADWNSGVTSSYATGDTATGVGAQRHCDLAPLGALEETVTEWQPGERLVVSIDSAARLPLSRATATFSLRPLGDETATTVEYEYAPRFGRLGALLGPLIDRRLMAGFGGFLDELEAAARSRSAASAAD